MKYQGNRILVELEAVAFRKLIVDLSNAPDQKRVEISA
jgi:hypothetical protein